MLRTFLLFLFTTSTVFAAIDPRVTEAVIVVDKKSNTLHLANYNDAHLEIIKSYHTTLGQNTGDKLMEGDLKTPEGIYEFLFRKAAPDLRAIFGPLAIYVGYPNPMDKTGRKTGFDIMLHGTDNPARLEKNFDSKGCVVLDNENVKEVSEYVKLNNTKVVITRDFSQLQSSPRIEKAKEFLSHWLNAWSTKNLPDYIESYTDEFHNDGMDRIQYAKYKNSLNQKYDTISITAKNARFYFHEKYDLVEFDQEYKSTFKGGIPAYNGVGHKRLYIQERNGLYKIVMELAQKK